MKDVYRISLAILVGLLGALHEKTDWAFFDYAAVISAVVVGVLSIYNITALVKNKKATKHKKWHLFEDLFFLMLAYTYVLFKLIF